MGDFVALQIKPAARTHASRVHVREIFISQHWWAYILINAKKVPFLMMWTHPTKGKIYFIGRLIQLWLFGCSNWKRGQVRVSRKPALSRNGKKGPRRHILGALSARGTLAHPTNQPRAACVCVLRAPDRNENEGAVASLYVVGGGNRRWVQNRSRCASEFHRKEWHS